MNSYICTGGGCCPPPCPPNPPEPQPLSDPCAEGFYRILRLLCSGPLAEAVDFNAFAFVTAQGVLGAGVHPLTGCETGDNLGPLGAVWDRSSTGEQLNITAQRYPPVPGAEALCPLFTRVGLDALTAVVFRAVTDAPDSQAAFDRIFEVLFRMLQPQGCCTQLPKKTMAAGPLVVVEAIFLGQAGPVLVLADPGQQRFYLLCADKVEACT